MKNEFSGTGYGPVVQAGHIDHLEVHNRQPITQLRQLPPEVALIGRGAELADLRSLIDTAPAAIVVNGPPWAGKSAVAVAFAHEIVDRYPDGQIYLDFGGNAHAPMSREESLRWALQSLGIDDAYIPDKLAHLVSAYRSALADKRVLVLLDNLADDTAVDLFTTKAGLVLATYRGVLSNNVATLHVHPLAAEDSTALLQRDAGQDVTWDGDDADRLVRLCGGLPLAVVAVANRLRGTTGSAGWFADVMFDGRNRLSPVTWHGTTLRDSLAASYRRLPAAVRHAFPRLGAFPGETITSWAIEAATGCADESADEIRRAMLAEGLLIERRHGGTTELPMPFRLVAKELLAEEEDPSAPARILDQITDHYVAKADSAVSVWLGDHPPDIQEDLSDLARRTAHGFFAGESRNLVRLLEHAATHRLGSALGLALPLLEFFTLQDQDSDLDAVHEPILRAARELPDNHRDAFDLLLDLNRCYARLSRPTEAADCLITAQRVAQDADDDQRATEAARLLLTAFEDKLADARDSQDGDKIANSLVLVAGVHHDLGDSRLARQLLLEALNHYRATDDVQEIAEILAELGDVSRAVDHVAESAQFLRESVRLFEQTDDRVGLALALESLAETLTGLGMHAEATAALERSDALTLADR